MLSEKFNFIIMEDFKIIHLSDLHIYGGFSQRNPSNKHSIDHMKGLQKIILDEKVDLDRIIITGDISHYGDEDSLLRAKQWIFNSMEIGNDERISIGLDESDFFKIRLIPGNHDAWNSKILTGIPLDRRQKSLSNFNFAFKKNNIDPMPFPDGCFYDWIEKDGRGVFFVYLDSSFLGDTKFENDNIEVAIFDKIAKGKISRKQAEKVLMLYDKGIAGSLVNPNDGTQIDNGIFAKALKVIVMHHYLFEPHGVKVNPLLQIENTEIVFRNLALADADILLCGHRHYSDFKEHLYIHHFNKRAKARYIFNYFRRLIGINSLPFQYSNEQGKKVNKYISSAISVIIKMHSSFINRYSNGNTILSTDDEFVEKLTEIFLESIENAERFEKDLRRFIRNHNSISLDDDAIEENELKEIVERINKRISDDEKQKLRLLSLGLRKIVKELFSRKIFQLMAGSLCKAHDNDGTLRSFNIYRIKLNDDGCLLRCEKFIWNNADKSFHESHSQRRIFELMDQNRPLH